MHEEYHKYVYEGPVLYFDRLVAEDWKGETMAPSEKKARSNLTYQFKAQNNMLPGSRYILPGKIKMVN